ncbi:MAG: precorrin-6y C5,15-methyltransferase (decarboxylating) subunit CbiE [Prevotella sp.]|nr:precorrin-6y C5,15-methyltransferase (decarboxylating) subunit CbiE [Prevotella sp.]
MKVKFIIIGITDEAQPQLSNEVVEIISRGRVFSGGKRHHEIMKPYLPEENEWIDITVPLERVFNDYRRHFGDRPDDAIVVVASGDPLFFGFANTVKRELPDAEISLYPSFNSLQTLAHRLVMPYHDMRIVSLTGRDWHEFDRALIEHAEKLGVLTDRVHTPSVIAKRMLEYGYDKYVISVGEHLGNRSEEKVSTMTLEEAAQTEFSHPNCLILKAEEKLPPRRLGLPDSEFELLNGRDKMITKMSIRLLSLQALELYSRQVLWDIGFCTGSVSIEARLQFPHLLIESFEIREEGRSLIDINTRRFGAPGISSHIGDFLKEDISALPKPDAVFIGGHGGKLIEIFQKVAPLLEKGGIIVMNSVTAESKQLFHEACRLCKLKEAEPLRIAVNDYHPIEIMKAVK